MGDYLTTVWAKLDLASLVLGALIGVLPSTWFNFFIKRPKLSIAGTGGGGGQQFGYSQISLANAPALLGFRFPRTEILGFSVNEHHDLGLQIDRAPVRDCRAMLFDMQTGDFIANLFWRGPDGPVSQITLGPGERYDLPVFAKASDQPGQYFAYQPDPLSEHPLLAPPDERFSDAGEFLIRLHYSGRWQRKIYARVTKRFRGGFSTSLSTSRRRMQGGSSL